MEGPLLVAIRSFALVDWQKIQLETEEHCDGMIMLIIVLKKTANSGKSGNERKQEKVP